MAVRQRWRLSPPANALKGTLLEQIVEVLVKAPEGQSLFMSERTFERLLREDGRSDTMWRQPGVDNRVFGVPVYFVNEMPDDEWIIG